MFQSPVNLIYTRRLVDPEGAAKLTGKLGATSVALLSGVDGTEASATGTNHAILNAMRLRQDLGGQNTLGLVYTDRVDGSSFNGVGALDGRLVLADAYAVTVQGGASATRTAGATLWAPMWYASLVRAGRRFGLNVSSVAFGDGFNASGGFLSRRDIVQATASPSYTIAGQPGSWLESFTGNVHVGAIWDQYRHFTAGHAPDDRQFHINTGFTLRGGWQLGASVLFESFGYPPELYANYWVERVRGALVDTIPFTGTPRLPNLDFGFNLQTPRFQTFSASAFLIVGRDENFYEWASGHIVIGTLDLSWRPSEQLRTELIYDHQQIFRPAGGSTVALIRVPRLKVEYQLTRSVFLRFVGQYTSSQVDALRDDSRTGGAILVRETATGAFTRSAPSASNAFRVDWLFSYRPTPGTVVFVGYGSGLDDAGAFRFRNLARRSDGFFVKLSYLIRA